MITIEAYSEAFIRGVIEGIHGRLFNHNKSVSKGNGGEYVNIEEELQTALYRLEQKLIEIALAESENL